MSHEAWHNLLSALCLIAMCACAVFLLGAAVGWWG